MFVAQRGSANQEPAIFTVSSPQAHFILGWFPGGHVRAPLFKGSWNVIRMHWARRFFNFLLQRKARIVQPTLIEEINSAVWPDAPGHSGNGVGDQAQAIFALAQCLLGSLALANLLSHFSIPCVHLSPPLSTSLFYS